MRIYQNPIEMLREVERDLYECGVTNTTKTVQDKTGNFETLELTGYTYTLVMGRHDWNAAFNYMKMENHELSAMFAEAKERTDHEYLNPGSYWRHYEELWKKYLHDGRFAYTYNERFRDQLPLVIEELTLRPTSRQVVMTVYDKHQDLMNWGGRARIPCSMYYQFVLRNEQLNLIYTMRSCDFLNHYLKDVYLAYDLLDYVANAIEANTGDLTHFLGSLHAFKSDMKKRGIF